MEITITISNGTLSVKTPYNSEFVNQAKRLGGKWQSANKSWSFDSRLESNVRKLCIETYGTDGQIKNDLVTVQVNLNSNNGVRCGAINLLGRPIAFAYGRDSGAKLGDGVVLLSGGFSSGGSVKNWRTDAHDGTTVQIFDFPKGSVEIAKEQGWDITIVEDEVTSDNKALSSGDLEFLSTRKIDIENQMKELQNQLNEINSRIQQSCPDSEFTCRSGEKIHVVLSRDRSDFISAHAPKSEQVRYRKFRN